MTYGEYGPYCPVTLKDDGWLVPGKEKENEVTVRGLRHKFFNEECMNALSFNYVCFWFKNSHVKNFLY